MSDGTKALTNIKKYSILYIEYMFYVTKNVLTVAIGLV